MKASKVRVEAKPKRARKHRSRPLPKWLKERRDLDDMARRRCLLVLAVLSGVKPVTEAIAEAGMSRGSYYQLEEKALDGMLAALGPTPPGRKPDQSAEIAELQAKVEKMEEEKRRAERLLLLTQKVVRKGRLVFPGRGRPRSTTSGEDGSSSSETTSQRRAGLPSTPKPGAAAP
jgi:hypothetical protein